MSLAYCYDCLIRIDECTCGNPSTKEVFGETRVAYLEGYRDAKNDKEENL